EPIGGRKPRQRSRNGRRQAATLPDQIPAERRPMMPAARVGDMHVCAMVTVLVPHVGGPILPPGAITVLIGGMPAARVADMCVCVGPPDVIVLGSFTVLICGMPAARMLDLTAHGGVIVLGCFTVLIN